METESKKLEQNQNDSTKRNYFRVFATTQESDGSKYEQGKILDNGVIPSWLSGVYLKLGPGKFDFESKDKKKTNLNSNKNKGSDKENHQGISPSDDVFTVNNFVDGYAVITRFEIKEGQVTLQKKFIQSDAYKKALVAGRPVQAESHTCCSPDPSKGFFRKFIPTLVPDMSDNTAHAFFEIGGSIFASNESYHLWKINPDTLESVKKYDTSKLLGVNQTSAHPVSDDHHTFSVGTIMSATGCKYVIMKTPLSKDKNHHKKCSSTTTATAQDDSEALSLFKQSKSICSISPWSMTLTAFMHSITITRHFAILVEAPFFTNLKKVATTITFGKNFCYSDWMETPSETGSQVTNRFYIIDKDTGLNLSSNIELHTKIPFYFSHFINSYEDKNEDGEEILVIDICGYKDTQVYQCPPLHLQSLRNNGPFKLEGAATGLRFLIPLSILKNENKWNQSIAGDNLLSEKCRDQYKIPITKNKSKNKQSNNIINTDSVDADGEQSCIDDCAGAVKKDHNKIILTPQVFTEKGIEWPIINKDFQGTNYKYFYGSSGFFKSDAYSNSLFKINMATGETIKYVDENCIFGEPCFIPEPESTEVNGTGVVNKTTKTKKKKEDDGVLLVTLHDTRVGNNIKDSLLILNAKDLKVVARVAFDAHIPVSNHGLFLHR